MMNYLCPKRNFDTFNGIENQKAEMTIEQVILQNPIESDTRMKRMIGLIIILIRVGICSQSVIANV